MKKKSSRKRRTEMLAEYDFRRGQRGKYAKRFQEGSNVVVLDPDVARVFPDPKLVNETLRTLSKILGRDAESGSS